MEGRCKTEYLNRFLQTALGRNAATAMFLLLQVATHLPVTEQFAPRAFQLLPLLLLLVMEAPHAYVFWKVRDYGLLGVLTFNCHTRCKNCWYWAISSSFTPLKMQAANPGVLTNTNWLLNTN